MKISKQGLDFIKSFESFVPYVYDDLVPPHGGQYHEWKKGDPVHGTLTCGYGHTDAAKYGLPFRLKDVPDNWRIGEGDACNILNADLAECEEQVNSLVKVEITQGMYDALCSFNFNCGVGNLKKLIAPLNAGQPNVTRAKFDAYVKSKGVTLRGLQRRRDGEQALWDEGDQNLPTVVVDHPAVVDNPTPSVVATLVGSRSVRAQGASIFALMVGGFDYVRDQFNAAFHFVMPAADYIPDVVNDTQSTISQSQQVASWFNLDLTHAMVVIALGGLTYAIIRRVLDKREQAQ